MLNQVIQGLGDRVPRERITIDIDCSPDIEINSITSDWISIFINLIANSLKHGFQNRATGVIEIHVHNDADQLLIDYRDDGRGMTPEARSKVFDPFFSTDLHSGMGLGMHLVYNLITHRLGGTIQCRSEPDQGVHFHIEVPL